MTKNIDKIEIFPSTGHIGIREVLDDGTYHRSVIDPGDDEKAAEKGITHHSDAVWTKKIRDKVKADKIADKKHAKEQEIENIKAKKAKQKEFDDAVKKAVDKMNV